jgi:hypothetical protein
MSTIPLALPTEGSVLIAGAGGGFDFLCGLPIALELESRGHEVHIASYSFTKLGDVRGARWHTDKLLEVFDSSSIISGDYFPELYLSQWYRERREQERSVWCLAQAGVRPTLSSYNFLIDKLGVTSVICVDGGVDGIFRGDEHDLGTPSMDSISVIATSMSNASARIYACAAFGTEGAEGKVSHAQALNRIADLIAMDAFLGVGAVRKNSFSGADFLEAVDYIFARLSPLRRSIIVSTVVAAMKGVYGNKVVHEKTQHNPPWISPLTSLIWYLDADAVAKIKLFYDEVKDSTSVAEVAAAIEETRKRSRVKAYESIPI